MITKNWNRLQITLSQVNILNWREPHQISPNSIQLVPWQIKDGIGKRVTIPFSHNLACLVRLYCGGQWTIAESKLESSLIEINRRFPVPLCYFIPRCRVLGPFTKALENFDFWCALRAGLRIRLNNFNLKMFGIYACILNTRKRGIVWLRVPGPLRRHREFWIFMLTGGLLEWF